MQEKNINTVDILKRIKSIKGLKTDKSLAEYLGVSSGVLSNWKVRNSIDLTIIVEKCSDIDLNYIIHGVDREKNNEIEKEQPEVEEKKLTTIERFHKLKNDERLSLEEFSHLKAKIARLEDLLKMYLNNPKEG